VLALVVGLIGFAVKKLSESDRIDVRVVVINSTPLNLVPLPESKLVFEPIGERTEDQLSEAIGRKEIDGVLRLKSVDDAELMVAKEPYWEFDLRQTLAAARGREKLKELKLSEAQLGDLLSPMPLNVQISKAGTTPKKKAEKVLAGVVVTLAMLGTWVGLAFFLIGITGEKQLRVTEQLVASMSPQTWIDGKLLGLTGVGLATMGTYLFAGIVIVGMMMLAGVNVPLPDVAGSPGMILTFLVLSVLGMFFWNCFFAAMAATINDPYTSSRGSLMMLPLIPVFMAAFSMNNPDTTTMKVLGMTPGFSSAVLPSRMVLTDVAWWEPFVAVGLLLVGIWFLRRLAGKIFAMCILIYGKEPTFREIGRQLRQG